MTTGEQVHPAGPGEDAGLQDAGPDLPAAEVPGPVLVAGRPRTDAAVAVCVPVLDGVATVGATVASVLMQTRRDLELVVLDNASTDGTAEVLAAISDPRLTVYRNPVAVPMVANFRRVVGLSHAPLVKLLPADDVLEPRAVELAAAPMLADPTIALVAGRATLVDDRGVALVPSRRGGGPAGRRTREQVVRRIVRHGGNPVGADVALLFRRDAYEAAGGYPHSGGIHGDIALIVALLAHGDFVGLRETVGRFRVAPGTHTARTGDDDAAAAHHAWVDRLVGADPALGRRDALVGRVGARLARARRELLFGLVRRRAAGRAARAARAARRQDRP